MKFKVPEHELTFEIPDDWWESANLAGYSSKSSHYNTDLTYIEIVAIKDITPPLRDGGLVWFRDRETVVRLLYEIKNNKAIEPIEVWNKEKSNLDKYIVYDGFHRFYLSIAMGYTKIPIREKFDFDAFFSNEATSA